MDITDETKIDPLLEEYPFLLDFLPTLAREYENLKNPLMRRTIGRMATLDKVARMGDMELPRLLGAIADEVRRRTGERPVVRMHGAELPADPGPALPDRKEALKGIIRDLHAGADSEDLKRRFSETIADISPGELAAVEQSLIDEGLPEEEVKNLCSLHVEVFKDGLDRDDVPAAPGGHPLHTFMMENRAAENILARLDDLLCELGDPPDVEAFDDHREELLSRLRELGPLEVHYARKENQLFPALERHGVTGPTQVMWAVHDDIRANLKDALDRTGTGAASEAVGSMEELSTAIRDMVYKEEHILYPLSLEHLTEAEWVRMRQGEGDIGYAWITPSSGWEPRVLSEAPEELGTPPPAPSAIELETGHLTPEQLNLMLKHMPVDMTFVDADDKVAYFSATEHRIFPRSPGIIGREVSKCHPPKSVHVVERIVGAFKSGERDVAEFWIDLGGRLVHIRYFAVRDGQGRYVGTLEFSQDLTDLKGIEGQRRLLDWE
jgi:DUF438 domain-containing protein